MENNNTGTKNLGQIAAIWINSSAPENQKLIWYDTVEQRHKVYDTHTNSWESFNPKAVTDIYINDLATYVRDEGGRLSIGDFYYLKDLGTLAIAITDTKIWYVNSHNNYIVNDLDASIVTHISSDNLLIDGSTGVWNTVTERLEFNFTQIESGGDLQTDDDYVVIRRKNGTAWSWIKSKLSGFISAVSGNSISWNNGVYFNISNAIERFKNVSGGFVGFEKHNDDLNELANNISDSYITKQDALIEMKSYADSKTTSDEIYSKRHSENWNIKDNPPNTPNVNDDLETILQILVSWANVLQSANSITLGSGFAANGRDGDVNYTDTVRAAIEKLSYKAKVQSKADGVHLPSGFNTNGRDGDFSASDAVNVVLEKLIYRTLLHDTIDNISLNEDFYIEGIEGEIQSTDKLNVVLEKLIYLANLLKNPNNINLPIDWSEGSYSGAVSDTDSLSVAIGKICKSLYDLFISDGIKLPTNFDSDKYSGLPIADDNLTVAIGKLLQICKQLSISNGSKLPDDFDAGDYDDEMPSSNNTLTEAIGRLASMINGISMSFNNKVWESGFREEDWSSLVNVGNKIGEFDSDGNPLYTASLEGALYLLSAWYSQRMNLRVSAKNYNAYYTESRGDSREEHVTAMTVMQNENGINFKSDKLRFSTYQALSEFLTGNDTNDDAVLIIRDLPQNITERLGAEYGYAVPINTNIPVVGYIGGLDNIMCHGVMYAILVQPPVGVSVDAYLKFIPYFTHCLKFGYEPGIAYDNEGVNIIPTGENICYISQKAINENGEFGSGWMAKEGFSEEMITVSIPKFNFTLTCK